MPLDTSTYSLALLRLDGRRWNELRRLNAQISTQAAADGSSYLEMGNTKVICTVTGLSRGKETCDKAMRQLWMSLSQLRVSVVWIGRGGAGMTSK